MCLQLYLFSFCFFLQKINIKEEVIWLESHLKENLRYKTMKTWLTVAPLKYSIENEVNFCDPNLLQSIINEKVSALIY